MRPSADLPIATLVALVVPPARANAAAAEATIAEAANAVSSLIQCFIEVSDLVVDRRAGEPRVEVVGGCAWQRCQFAQVRVRRRDDADDELARVDLTVDTT